MENLESQHVDDDDDDDNDDDDGKDDENMVVLESVAATNNEQQPHQQHPTEGDSTQQHGYLVAQILETQRELVNVTNLDLVSNKIDITVILAVHNLYSRF